MAKKKKKVKVSVLAFVMLAVIAVGLVLSIIGLTTNWIDTKGEAIAGIISTSGSLKLEDLLESQKNKQEISSDAEIKYLDETNAFVWITIIAVGVCLAMSLFGTLLKMNLLKTLSMIVGCVAIIAAVLTIVFTNNMCQELSADGGILAKVTTTISTGCYLVMAGGILGGAGAIVSKFS